MTQLFSTIRCLFLTRGFYRIYPRVRFTIYLMPLLLIGCTLLLLREAGGRAGGRFCAWAFYDPSSSPSHPVKCLTTINLNSPPPKIASTMRWLLICEEASRWSSVTPPASPTRRQREILIQKESSYPGAITSINQISWPLNGAVRSVGLIVNYAARLIVAQIYGPVAICRRVYPPRDI